MSMLSSIRSGCARKFVCKLIVMRLNLTTSIYVRSGILPRWKRANLCICFVVLSNIARAKTGLRDRE